MARRHSLFANSELYARHGTEAPGHSDDSAIHATDQAKRRAVDNLVKPESNSDASEPDYQQLKAAEDPAVASNFEIFGNGLAPEMKTASTGSP